MKSVLSIFLICFVAALSFSASSQNSITLNGVVTDSVSGKPVVAAAIFAPGAKQGALSDDDGKFTLEVSASTKYLDITAMGYRIGKYKILFNDAQQALLKLVPTTVTLNTLTVKRKKEKYSKKNNPAVEFIEKVMARKHQNDPRNNEYYQFLKYTKINCGIAAPKQPLDQDKNKVHKKLRALYENVDTNSFSGKPVIPVMLKETVSNEYFRSNPKTHKEIVLGNRNTGLDAMLDKESIQRFLEDVFREIDIFGNDVTCMQNRFVSPLSVIGTNYYKYYLNDTIEIDGEPCIDLSFAPHNAESFGFTGRLYFPVADTTFFIKKVKLNVPKSINLNYVEKVTVEQDFVKAPDGSRLKTRDDMSVEFQIIKGTTELYAQRTTSYSKHSMSPPNDMALFDLGGERVTDKMADYMPDEFWRDNRTTPLKESEGKVSGLLKNLRKVPLWYWTEKVLVALVAGYVSTNDDNSKFDFGPMNTTISGNTLEGVRLRVGGMTTANLNPHLFARGYVAYGTKDGKFKYSAELEYSFKKKKYHNLEFPVHSLKLSHKYDLDRLGQHYLYTNADNVFLAIKRQPDNKMTYRRHTALEYTLETPCGFSLNTALTHTIQEASPYVPFINGYGCVIQRYSQAAATVTLRYAPGEKFYQTKNHRIPINYDAPVFTISHTYSPKGFMGSMFEINKTELGIQKRFWFSAFGYTDIILKAGKIWSTVPFTDLLLPNANLSYTVQPESYSLMNAMEFVNDQYLSWDVTYWANGWMFNRIPLLKKLKLREVFSFRGLMGSLKDSNDPPNNPDLFYFPKSCICAKMTKTPYMEIGVGIDNILTFLRLDYVWRLTYNDHVGINHSGLRVQLHFTF